MTDNEMAAALKAKGWKVEEPWTKENCKHPPHMKMGSGGIGADGSSFMSWHCRQCRKSDSYTSPPNRDAAQFYCWNLMI